MPVDRKTQYRMMALDTYVKWAVAHPNHCQECHGTGYNESGRLSEDYHEEICQACTPKGICPACGHQHAEGEAWEGMTCEVCEWDYEDNRTRSPYEYAFLADAILERIIYKNNQFTPVKGWVA